MQGLYQQQNDSSKNVDNTNTSFTLNQIRWLRNNDYNFDKMNPKIPLKDRAVLLTDPNHGVFGGTASGDTINVLADRGDAAGVQKYIDYYKQHSTDPPQTNGAPLSPEAYSGRLHLSKQDGGLLKSNQAGAKYPPMNEAEASSGPMPPPMVPSTLGDRIHKGISDVATGVATWGTSFRPPTNGELQQGRGTWADRAKLLAGATTKGLTNEMIASGIGKVAGRFLPKPVPTPTPAPAPQPYINRGDGMFNKQNVINDLASSMGFGGEEGRQIALGELPKKSDEEFAALATKAGYKQLGKYWALTPGKIYEKGGLLSPKKARTILHDKSVRGHALTDKQRRFFGAMSNKKKQDGGSMQRQSAGSYD